MLCSSIFAASILSLHLQTIAFVNRWLISTLVLLRSHSFHRHCLGALDTLLLCSILSPVCADSQTDRLDHFVPVLSDFEPNVSDVLSSHQRFTKLTRFDAIGFTCLCWVHGLVTCADINKHPAQWHRPIRLRSYWQCVIQFRNLPFRSTSLEMKRPSKV